MKKLLILGAAAVAALFTASHASAQPVVTPDPTIGVQFTAENGGSANSLNDAQNNGNANPYGYQAGALNQQYWNVANNLDSTGTNNPTEALTNSSLITNSGGYPNTSTPTTLVDSTGATSTVTFSVTGQNYDNYNYNNFNSSSSFPAVSTSYLSGQPAQSWLVSGIAANSSGSVATVSLSFANLNDSDYYNVYAYVGSIWFTYSSEAAKVSLGNQSFYLLTDNGTLNGYTQATAGSAASATTADYVEFQNVLGSALDTNSFDGGEALTVTGKFTGLTGFQLEDIGSTPAAVPEPSTVWMFSLGFLGLMAHVYRRRCAQV